MGLAGAEPSASGPGVDVQESLKPLKAPIARLEEAPVAPPEWLANIEEMLRAQAEAIDSMRAALAQNEQLVETVVESLSAADSLNADALGDLVLDRSKAN